MGYRIEVKRLYKSPSRYCTLAAAQELVKGIPSGLLPAVANTLTIRELSELEAGGPAPQPPPPGEAPWALEFIENVLNSSGEYEPVQRAMFIGYLIALYQDNPSGKWVYLPAIGELQRR